MKNLLIATAFASMFLAGTAANAAPTNDPCAGNAKLEYRFYKNNTRKNYYNLAFETKADQPVIVKVINSEGQEVYSNKFRYKTYTTSLSLNKLAAGHYTLEVYQGAGCKINTETLTID